MKEQHGVPAFADVIRFNRSRATTTAQSGGPSTSNRSRTPPATIPRAGHSINQHPEDVPYPTDDIPSQAARYQRQRPYPPVFADADYGDEPRGARSHTTARHLDRNPLETRKLPDQRFDAGRLLVVVGIAMLIMLLGWFALSWPGTWWQTQTNDWTYGRPRTFQIDAMVGHHDDASHPSHFIALNLHRHVLVIEMPGGDPSKALIYTGPTLVGDGQDLTPVTLTKSLTTNTTGKGHQDARAATGLLTFYNGSFTSQTVDAGTTFTGADGIQIATDAPVIIPPNTPPINGQATVEAQAVHAGQGGNIQPLDINGTVSSAVYVKNLAMFTGGRDARDFQAVAPSNLANLAAQIRNTLSQQIPQDCLHKASHLIAGTLAERAVVIGDLSQRRMVIKKQENETPKERRKRHIRNRMVYNDWGLSGFVQMLAYKCLRFGKELSIINERDTTKMCHVCKRKKDMPLWQRTYRCENCGLVMDRDENSAVNIYERFLARPGPHTP